MCIFRSDNWWNFIVLETFTDHDWIENFRVSRETFGYICQQLRPLIMRQNTRFRQAISVEQRVGITLWFLATPAEFVQLVIYLELQDVLYVLL